MYHNAFYFICPLYTMSILVQEIREQPVNVELYFHQFFQSVVGAMPKVDPELLIRIMMFQVNLKKYVGPDIPHVNLYVYYKEGIDLHQKQEQGRDKYPIEITTSKWGDGVIFSGLMSIKNVQTICSDTDIVKVTGKATPRHN